MDGLDWYWIVRAIAVGAEEVRKYMNDRKPKATKDDTDEQKAA